MPSCLPASLTDNKGSRHSKGVVVQGLKKRSAEGHGGVSRLLLRRLSHSRRQKKKSPSTVSTGIMGTSIPQYSMFHADHPFLYLITESSTNAILFAGKFNGQ